VAFLILNIMDNDEDFLDFLDKLEILVKTFPNDQSEILALIVQYRRMLNQDDKT